MYFFKYEILILPSINTNVNQVDILNLRRKTIGRHKFTSLFIYLLDIYWGTYNIKTTIFILKSNALLQAVDGDIRAWLILYQFFEMGINFFHR